MSSFEEKVDHMKSIFRGEVTYGEGKPSEQAKAYLEKEMFDEIIARARKKSEVSEEKVDFLISLSGFSPATTILATKILRPTRLLVITSADARTSIDTIGKHLLGEEEGMIRLSDFSHKNCEPSDPLSIYEIIKGQLNDIEQNGGTGQINAYLDITGGKKVMSATAALAAWQLDLPLIYIDSEFDPEIRQPKPGTERALRLDNPTTIFGEQELNTALSIFDNGAFEAAATRFDSLAQRLANPTQARFNRDLSRMYQAWCDMNFDALPDFAALVEDGLTTTYLKIDNHHARRLEKQASFLKTLRPENRMKMLLSNFLLGLHYQEQGRHDFATLLFYRTIEGCFDVHLSKSYDGFDTNEPNYSKFDLEEDELTANYDDLAAQVFGESRRTGLPRKIGFMNAALLLAAIKAPLLNKVNMGSVRGLNRLQSIASIRNESILAHGFKRITTRESEELRQIAEKIFSEFWLIHADRASLKETYQPLQFIKLARSEEQKS